MSALEPGQRAFVAYDEGIWHERLVLGWIERGDHVVMSPDADIFIEQLDAANADLTGIRFCPPNGAMPYGLAGQPVYAFTVHPTGGDLAVLLAEGAQHVQTERAARGLGPGGVAVAQAAPAAVPRPPAAPVPGQPAVARLSPPPGVWVLDEPAPGHAIGDEVELPPGTVDVGGRCFVSVGGSIKTLSFVEAGQDIDKFVAARRAVLRGGESRLAPQTPGDRPVSIGDAASGLVQDPGLELPLRGPRTVSGSMAAISALGCGSFTAAHDRWVVESKIDVNNRSVYEHRVLSRAMQFALAEDGLNIKNLVSMEYLNRRRQLLEEAHREDVSKPCFDGSHHFMGEDDEATGAHVEPTLRAHVAAEFGKEAAIAKERRKAREAKSSGGGSHKK